MESSIKKILIALAISISIIGCQESGQKESTRQKEAGSLLEKQINDTAKADEALREEIKKRLVVLKKNFSYKQDKFNRVGWYTHSYLTPENTRHRKCLITHVSSTGKIYLESQYYGDGWLFHRRIEVKIGDKVFKSSDITAYSDNYKAENDGGRFWENISYTGNKDLMIIKAIAESDEIPVKVRFIGKTNHDFTLSSKDQLAFKESYELYRLIKQAR